MPWYMALRCVLRAPAGEGDPGGGGDPATPPGEKMLPQSEVQRIVAKEAKAAADKAAREAAEKFKLELVDRDKTLEELRMQLETAGKTGEEKARIEAEQKREAERKAQAARDAQIADQLRSATEKATAAEQRLRDHQVSGAVSVALASAKVLAGATEDAIRSFRADSQIETDEDGKPSSIIYKGVAYDTLKDAAKAFLKDRPHFAQPSAVTGAGVRTGGGNGAGGSKVPLHELDRTTLLRMSAAEKRGQRTG